MYLQTEEKAADDVLSAHWNRRLPIDPDAIAQHMGAQITAFFGPESGYLRIENGRVEIGVNRIEPLARQRFTVAHEIGHWVMGHGNSFRDPAANFSSSANSFLERQANTFAACLLMPRSAVLQLAHTKNQLVDDMARAFSVSRIAMEYRLKNLGLIS